MSTTTTAPLPQVRVLGTAQREAWTRGTLPPVETVRPGLWSIPVPMPRNPLRYVLVYALALDDGLALIDAGWPTEDAWRALVDGIRSIGYDVTDVRFAAITHLHPDHFGLAPRLRQASGAALAMHAADASALGHHTATDAARRDAVWGRQLEALGAPPHVVGPKKPDLVRLPRGESLDVVLGDADPLELPGWNLRALWTPGHTAGHLCFIDDDARIMFSGDHLLPRISPNISTTPEQLHDPLHRYLLSLHATADLPAFDVLPAHEYRFTGLAQRSRDLLAHHEDRFDEIAADVAGHPESTAWEITNRVSWSRPFDTLGLQQQRLALRETDAHLLILADRGVLRPDDPQPGVPQRWSASQANAPHGQ